MIFGIDLGTTNSLIGIGDQMLSTLVSSNVDVSQQKQVSRDFVSENVVSSYKVDMSMSDTGKLPIQCSAIILKTLAEMGTRRYGEEVKDVVISVPAYFSTSQREAVYEAAKIANLNVQCLINEPTAAGLYACKYNPDLIVVYDLGGGTFDVSIIDNRAGICSVLAFDGSDIGGDDLDIALMEEAFNTCKVPYRFRSELNKKHLKSAMRLAKEEIQRTKSDVYVDLKCIGVEAEYCLTVEKYKEVVRTVFGKTFEQTEYLISAYIPEYETPKIVFVGGSSNCPFLREMVHDAIDIEEIECDCNPDLLVARGVAFYAQLLYEGKADKYIEDVTKRLCIESTNGGSLTIIEENTIVPCAGTIVVSNNIEGDKLRLKLYQGDSSIAEKNDYIGMLVYDYGCVMEKGEGLVEVTASVTKDGIIKLSACDIISGLAQCIDLTVR